MEALMKSRWFALLTLVLISIVAFAQDDRQRADSPGTVKHGPCESADDSSEVSAAIRREAERFGIGFLGLLEERKPTGPEVTLEVFHLLADVANGTHTGRVATMLASRKDVIDATGLGLVRERLARRYEDVIAALYPEILAGEVKLNCEEPPDDARILRGLSPVTRGIPGLYEVWREDVEIVKERIDGRIDPPRFYPLVGVARLHHCTYKCSVFFNKTIEVAWPFSFCPIRKPSVEVVSINMDHLRLVMDSPPRKP
jgi:hypothetical protein